MDEKIYYLVYRIYNDQEHDSPYLMAWTDNKSTLKSYTSQRNPKKYIVYKADEEEMISSFSESVPHAELKIDYVRIKSSSTGETILFFTTLSELQEIEKKILRLVKKACSLDNICTTKNSKDLMYYFSMFMNLKEYYFNILNNIGFRPKEVDILFDSVGKEDDESIEYSYSEGIYLTEWCNSNKVLLPAQTLRDDWCYKIIYSMESIIKVLHDDL